MQLNNDITDNFADDGFQLAEWMEDILRQEEFENDLVFVDPMVLDQLPDNYDPYSLDTNIATDEDLWL